MVSWTKSPTRATRDTRAQIANDTCMSLDVTSLILHCGNLWYPRADSAIESWHKQQQKILHEIEYNQVDLDCDSVIGNLKTIIYQYYRFAMHNPPLSWPDFPSRFMAAIFSAFWNLADPCPSWKSLMGTARGVCATSD